MTAAILILLTILQVVVLAIFLRRKPKNQPQAPPPLTPSKKPKIIGETYSKLRHQVTQNDKVRQVNQMSEQADTFATQSTENTNRMQIPTAALDEVFHSEEYGLSEEEMQMQSEEIVEVDMGYPPSGQGVVMTDVEDTFRHAQNGELHLHEEKCAQTIAKIDGTELLAKALDGNNSTTRENIKRLFDKHLKQSEEQTTKLNIENPQEVFDITDYL